MKNNYGYFDDARREYVITDPRTPAKWINYLGTLAFGGFIDHTGGILLCAGDPAQNRITKYIPQMPDSDFKGGTLYIRIHNEDGSYEVFSPYFVPTLSPLDQYECRVGLAYQHFVSVKSGIRIEVRFFVPVGAKVLLQDIRVTNERAEPVDIDVIPVVEFSHFDALKQMNNADWVPQTMQCSANQDAEGFTLIRQACFMNCETSQNFFTSNHPVASFETDREKFLGANGYGSWRVPKALEQNHFFNYKACRGNNIGALMHRLSSVQEGETRRVIIQIGQAAPEAVVGTAKRFRDPAEVDRAFEALRTYWLDYLGCMQCETPDAAFNTMVNIHNPRQCQTTFNWSRSISLYQLAYGSRAMGFRDSSQDVMGVLASAPKEAKKLLSMLLRVQRPDGSAMHQFFPLTMVADEGDAREHGGKQVYGDDHLWVVLAVSAYLKETGDYGFLDESLSYYDKTKPIAFREQGTVLDHLLRAVAYTRAHVGQNGLPLLGYADWNDTVNLPGDAESLFNANLYGVALRELMLLFEHLEQADEVDRLRADWESMRDTVNATAWDGDWYVRYFTEAGVPVGSLENAEGRIFTNGQSWPVLSGFATDERAATALDSVNRLLNTANGIKLSWPGYTRFDPEKGGVSTYPPGAKENGGIFLHSNPWVIIAETMLGNGDRAFQYYSQINPAVKNDLVDTYEIEPYCYAQNILGDEHPQFGLGRNSWLSGTASWMYQAATQYILGIRPSHEGLIVDPCIPSCWEGFEATRRFRGATYRISVRNPNRICKGVTCIVVDEREIEGFTIPVQAPGHSCEIQVTLGEDLFIEPKKDYEQLFK